MIFEDQTHSCFRESQVAVAKLHRHACAYEPPEKRQGRYLVPADYRLVRALA